MNEINKYINEINKHMDNVNKHMDNIHKEMFYKRVYSVNPNYYDINNSTTGYKIYAEYINKYLKLPLCLVVYKLFNYFSLY